MKLGFTGTQHGATEKQMQALLKFFNYNTIEEFHHGDCIGADAQAHDIAVDENCLIVIHPPIKNEKRAFRHHGNVLILDKKAYLDRNHEIVDSTDVLIACPRMMVEELRSGTWATIRYARKKGKTVHILEP